MARYNDCSQLIYPEREWVEIQADKELEEEVGGVGITTSAAVHYADENVVEMTTAGVEACEKVAGSLDLRNAEQLRLRETRKQPLLRLGCCERQLPR